MDLKKSIEAININLDNITDPVAKTILSQLLNIIEALAQENKELKDENQKLRDENNRLKGERGKPNIRPQAKDGKDISSEQERKSRNKKKKKSKSKKAKIKIDRIVKCTVDKAQLPDDAIFKGYLTVIVQDISIKTDNIKFRKEIYYSPSLNKSFMAQLPAGYQGEFGPNVKAEILSLHFAYKMTEPAIVEYLKTHGIIISAATVSRMITDNHDQFHEEKNAIVQAGLPSTVYQQMDDTSARVNGKNHYTHVLCNPYYTAYFTRPNKNRLTILEILSQGELSFVFNESAYALMEQMKLSGKILAKLKRCKPANVTNRQEVDALLCELFPEPKKYATSKSIILEASAIVVYQKVPNAISILLTDDAPQ